MALTSRLVARIRSSIRGLGAACFVLGVALATAVSFSGTPPQRTGLVGVGNRFETAARLARPQPDRPLTFLVVGGDAVGLADALERGLREETQAAFAVLAGDLTTGPDPSEYDLFLNRIASLSKRPPVFCLRGRHEAGIAGDKLFARRLGDRLFHFSYRDSLFLLLDNAEEEVSHVQLASFDRMLGANRGRWRRVFAFVHRPPVPGGERVLVDFCRRHQVDAVVVGRADSDARERRGGTEWVSIGPRGATAIAFEVGADGDLQEREVLHGVGQGVIARAAHAWGAVLSPWIGEKRGVAFSAAAALILAGAWAWFARQRPLP